MHEELFDVVDEADRVIGQAPRSQVHAHRWLHRAVHVFVFNPRGDVLIQKRSAGKDEYPLRYTSSASGHLHAGEDYLSAAHRELDEELGLSGGLEFLRKFPAGPETSYEHSALYRMVTAQSPAFDPREIAAGEWLSPERLTAWIAAAPEDFTPCFRTLWTWYAGEILRHAT
jgi:isopentenyl-diphosphate delta-isomerase